MNTVTLTYICPNEECEAEIPVQAEVEPAEHGYGSDADGNRGIDVPASVLPPDVPSICPECGAVYTMMEWHEVASALQIAAENYDFNEGPEPDC